MKKTASFVAGALLVSALLSGCGSTAAEQAPSAQTNSNVQPQSNAPTQATQERQKRQKRTHRKMQKIFQA